MPRGVPNSGKRQPRAVPAADTPAETSLAAGAVYGQDRDEAPADETFEMAADASEDLIEIPTFELVPDDEPVEPELTAEQKEILRLKQQIALLSGQDVLPDVEELKQPGDASNILIHFLEDGFSALGRVFYRGEELEFEVGSRAYEDTFNKRGESWLDYRNDEFGQVDRWGKIFFRNGPWPGKTYRDGTYEALKNEKGEGSVPPPSKQQIEAAERARKRRAAPHLAPIA